MHARCDFVREPCTGINHEEECCCCEESFRAKDCDPRWRFRIYTGKDEAGRKVYEGRGGFGKEGEARKAMQHAMEEIGQRNTPGPAPQRTLGEWVRQWLDTYALDRCQPKTLERYRQLAAYVLTAQDGSPSPLAQVPLADLTHQQLEAAMYALLKAEGKRRKHISARTVRHVAGLLNVALNKAFRLELIQIGRASCRERV